MQGEEALAGLASDDRRPPRVAAAAAGALAAALAIGVGELLAGLIAGAGSPVLEVGALIIELQPPGAKQFVVDLVGEADKLALNVVLVVVALAAGAVLGMVALRRFGAAVIGFAAFALLGIFAALRDPLVEPLLAAVVSLGGLAAGLLALRWLLGRIATPAVDMPDHRRRRFLGQGLAVALGAVASGGVGRYLLEQRVAARDGSSTTDAPERVAGEPLPPGAELDVPGITPLVVPNESFYRIDTALLVPRLDAASWRLRVHGMVENEVELTYNELVAMDQIRQYVTIACVSNEVGDDLVGNAAWTGVPLRTVLDMAGVQEGATQIVGRAYDGWTAGFPTAWALDERREPLIALQMNDEPLPRDHGFPARLIVPGLFGYVSATKWLTEIELTTWEDFDGYWVPLGWAKEGPILTQSRIDVPRTGSPVAPGEVTVAGVAWAPDRGIRRVELSVDGEWRDAELSTPISDATWVQWRVRWDASPGRHILAVRATDGAGDVQTEERTRPAPDGARGHHTIIVEVG
jgi:DMSO/TMAO reductase YedYZ molybdopterin-dependent catalytic subunit